MDYIIKKIDAALLDNAFAMHSPWREGPDDYADIADEWVKTGDCFLLNTNTEEDTMSNAAADPEMQGNYAVRPYEQGYLLPRLDSSVEELLGYRSPVITAPLENDHVHTSFSPLVSCRVCDLIAEFLRS